MKNGAFIFYAHEDVYVVRCQSWPKAVHAPIKLDFQIKKSSYQVIDVLPTLHKDIILIFFREINNYTDSLILTWDIAQN